MTNKKSMFTTLLIFLVLFMSATMLVHGGTEDRTHHDADSSANEWNKGQWDTLRQPCDNDDDCDDYDVVYDMS